MLAGSFFIYRNGEDYGDFSGIYGSTSAFSHTGNWQGTGEKDSEDDKSIPPNWTKDQRTSAGNDCSFVSPSGHVCRLFSYLPGAGARGDFRQFGARQVAVEAEYEKEFVEKLCNLASKSHFPAGTKGEQVSYLDHGTMVPLYFVNQYWTKYRLVRIGLSGLSFLKHYELGMMIQQTAKDSERKTVVIGSGDLSHYLTKDGPYGFREEGPAYDEMIMKLMEKGAFRELLECSEEFCQKAGSAVMAHF